MTVDPESLRCWLGRRETAADRVWPERVRALHAVLDRPGAPPAEGEPLPPLWHWLYFWTIVPGAELGRDGHPALGGFLPPIGQARRMWAGSRITFERPLPIGATIERRSTIQAIEPKRGLSGGLVFVTVRHEIMAGGARALVDEHDIVYREDGIPAVSAGLAAGQAARPPRPAPDGAAFERRIVADPALLFRYSALTFNGHRIHYDRDYATGVEGYPGLVIHGPLLATWMAALAADAWPDRVMTRFHFRGERPVIDGEPFLVRGMPADDRRIDLWIATGDRGLAMTGHAGFA